jgi:hypothetical protein
VKQVHKEYQQPFLLEPTKLSRIVDAIHARLADHRGAALHDAFEVFLTGNQREELSNLDEVLGLTNSSKRRIERLVVLCSASEPGSVRPDHEIQVDFGGPKSTTSSSGANTKVVAISVRSDSPGWAGRVLAEVEEQVERTWLRYTQPVVFLIAILLAMLLLLTSQLHLEFVTPLTDRMWLRDSDLYRLDTILAGQPTLTDENVRELLTMQLHNVLEAQRPTPTLSAGETRRTLFVVVPVIVVLTCSVILVVTCYPTRVFLWGDEVERYADALRRRRVTWNIVIGVIIVGVAGNLLTEAIVSWFPGSP